MSPRFVCHSCFSVSGPGVPAISLLTPLRAESCSSSGQSSSAAAVVVGVGPGEGEVPPEADGAGEALGVAVGEPGPRGVGDCPCPLHAHRIAAMTTIENESRGEQRKTASHLGFGRLTWNPSPLLSDPVRLDPTKTVPHVRNVKRSAPAEGSAVGLAGFSLG